MISISLGSVYHCFRVSQWEEKEVMSWGGRHPGEAGLSPPAVGLLCMTDRDDDTDTNPYGICYVLEEGTISLRITN